MGHVIKLTPSEEAFQEFTMLRNLCFPGMPLATAIMQSSLQYMRQMGTSSIPQVPVRYTPSILQVPVSLGTDLDPTPLLSSPISSLLQDPEGDPRGAGTIPEPSGPKQVGMALDDDTAFLLDLWAGTVPFSELKDPAGLLSKVRLARPDLDHAQVTHELALWWQANPAKRKTARGLSKFVAGWWTRQGKPPAHGTQVPMYGRKISAEEENAAAWERAANDPEYGKGWQR